MDHSLWRVYATHHLLARTFPEAAGTVRFARMRRFLKNAANQRSEFCRRFMVRANQQDAARAGLQQDVFVNDETRRLKRLILSTLAQPGTSRQKALIECLKIELNVVQWAIGNHRQVKTARAMVRLLEAQEKRILAEIDSLEPSPTPTAVA